MRRRPRFVLRRAGLAALLVAAACGYTLGSGRGRFVGDVEAVFVRPLENRTTDSEVGALVSAAIRRELALREADGGPGAPARIEGAVEESSFGASSTAGTYVAKLVLSARLVVNGKAIAEKRVVTAEEWLGGLDPLESEGRRRVALRRAADAAAREIVESFEMQR